MTAMKIYQYKCTLLSDIIITSDAATEAPSEALDYIPGSKFLGIVAGKLYDEEQKTKTLDLFHNGVVQYGDATLYYNGKSFLKSPFSWFTEKGKSIYDKIYLHHLLTKTDLQLKQVRTGYFSPETQAVISLNLGFSLKSAQDFNKRRSEDGKMFGYQSLKAGTEWIFEIIDEKGIYSEEIKNVLVGKQRIGRSRSAEYGLIDIQFLQEEHRENQRQFSNEIIIYAKSNLCFVDEVTGAYTAQPSAEQLCGEKDAAILWNKSQVRSRNYKVWNRHRWNKDGDRIIVERGSVFVVKINRDVSEAFFKKGIGSHKSEGFGQVIVNPDFLRSSNEFLGFKLSKQEIGPYQKSLVVNGESDDLIFKVLQDISKRKDISYQIDKLVNQFKNDHKGLFDGISKSQWSTLRNYGKHLTNRKDFMTMVFDKESGFVYRGQSENEWRQKNRRIVLQEKLETIDSRHFFPFVLKLSSQMSKRN